MNILPAAITGASALLSSVRFRRIGMLVAGFLVCFAFSSSASPFTLSFSVFNYNGFEVSCNGAADGSIDMTTTGGTLPFVFEWSNGATTEDISSLNAGIYIVTVIDADQDTVRDTITISEPAALSAAFTTVTDVLCNGGSTGAVDMTPGGGTGVFTYSWSSGATTEDVSGLTAATYTVTVTDNNGCSVTETVPVGEPPPLLPNVSHTDANAAPDGTASSAPSGGVTTYTYLWSTGQTTATITGLLPGVYTVTVTDANLCTVTDSVEVLNAAGVCSVVTDSVFNSTCFNSDDAAIYISLNASIAPVTYQWSSGAVTQDVTGLSPGTYTVTATDVIGCIATQSFTVTEPDSIEITLNATGSTCGNANGSVSGSVIGGTSPYTYLWSTGATTLPITSLAAGTYTITVTDANGCTNLKSVVVTGSPGPIAALDSVRNVGCNGALTGGVFISVSGGTPVITYLWSNGATTQDITGVGAGTYTVTVTDGNLCTSVTSGSVTQPAALNDSVQVINASCGSSNGSITVYPYGGTPGYTYLWSNAQTTQTISSLTAGNYTVTITDAAGCTRLRSAAVSNTGAPVIALDSIRNVRCSGQLNGGIYISVSSGASPYTYLWSNGATTQDITSLAAGNYTVTVTDASLCAVIFDTLVTQPAALNDSVQWVNPSCGLSNGSITVYPYGGTSPFTYQWNTGQTTQTISSLAAGTYTVTIRDANLCSRTRTRIITNQAGPVAVLDSVRNVACFGGATGAVYISVTGGTSPLSYLWSNGATVQDITGLTLGTYSVTVTDANLCTSSISGVVTQPTALNDSVTVSNATCGTASGSITEYPYGGTSPYTYLWSTGQTTQTIASLAAGTYTVTIRDANNCSRTRTNVVTQSGSPAIAMDSLRNVRCNGQSNGAVYISVSSGTSPYTYLWSNAATTQDITSLSAGNYTVTVTDQNGCTAVFDTTVTQPSVLNTTVQITNATCGQSNGAVTANPTGGTSPYTFLWSTGQTTQTITGLAAAVYTVTVTDANSCTHVRTANVGNAGGPVIALDSLRNVRCNGQSNGAVYISVTAGTSPYTYLWSNGATTQDITSLAAGNYTVTVTDQTGCQAIFDTTVTQPAVLNETVNITPSTCGQATGAITVTPSGGTSPYTYLWNTGQTTATITGLLPATYTVTITDANLCTKQRTAVVGSTGGVTIVTDSIVNVKCFGASTGAVYISLSSGTSPFTYQWTGGAVAQDLVNVVAGTYTVSVSDANGCTATQSFVITQPASALNDSVQSQNASCGLLNGSVTVYPYGGTPGYTYLWNTGQTTQSLTGLAAGTYTVTIRDANLCSRTRTRTITAQAGPVAAFDSVKQITCNGAANGAIYISVTGGTAPLTYLWNSGQTTQDITGLNTGNYTVTVTDANGCTSVLDTSITQPANLSAATNIINARCGLPNGSVTVNPSGGTSPYTYLWNTGQTTQSITSLAAGTYTVTVTDANLCTRVRTVTVSNIPGPTAVVDSVRNVRCNGAATGAIYITPSGGTAPLSYSWSNGATTQDLVNVIAGNYTVTVTDANLCTVVLNAAITQPTAIADSLQITNANCGAPTGIVTVFPYGGTSPYTLLWSTGQTTATIFSLAAGSYTVTITDAFSCTKSVVANVSNNGAPAVAIDSIRNIRCFGGSTGGIFISVSGGTSPYSYLWSNGATTQDLTNVPAASYTVTITDANSCLSIISGNVTQPTQLQDSTVFVNPICGAANGTATAYPYGGTIPYSYQWSSGQTTQSVTGLAAGTYTVTIRDANLCSRTNTVTLTNQGGPTAVVDSVKNVRCFGGSTGAVYISVTNGTAPLTYLWSNAATTEDITGVPAATYTITVTDANGCTASVNAQVSQPAALNDSIQVVPEACNGVNGSATVFAYGGTSPYTYQWNTGQTTSSITGQNSGPYTVTITDANLCTKVRNVNIGVSGSPAILTDSIVQVKCNGGLTGAVYVTVAGGQTPYSYLWSSGAVTQDLLNVGAGNYSLIVSDSYLCRDTAYFTITQPAALNDSINTVSATCGLPNATATVYPYGGTSPYSYLWSGGQTTQTITALATGTYTVTIRDANLCTRQATVAVQAIVPPSIQTDSIVDVQCNGAFNGGIYITVLNGTPQYQYLWSNSDITQDLSGIPAGNYTVTVTDANSCTAVQSFTVAEPSPISDSLDITDATCGIANGSATVYPYGGGGAPFTYLWSTGATTQTVTGLSSGFYAVTITDASGCSVVETVSISNLNGPQATVDSIISVTCNGGNDGAIYLTVTGSGPFVYLWSNGATTQDITGLTANTYSVTVTDVNNCLFVNTYNVVEPDPIADSSAVTDATCGLSNGQIIIYPYGGTPPYGFLWNTGATTQVISGLSAATYTVTVSDFNGCTKVSQFNVVSLPGPQLAIDSVVNVNCFGDSTGMVYISVTGGTPPLDYLWSNGAVTTDLLLVPAGVYTVTVTDLNGCSASVSSPVNESPEITSVFTITQASCNTANGSIAATVSGGAPGYTYAWSTGATTSSISSLTAGTYTLTVSDQLGCLKIFDVNVSNISAPEITVVDSGNVTCTGLTNGFILVNVSSGTPPYSYAWTNTSQTGNFITNLAGNTTYTLTITDSIGCLAIRSVFISEPLPISINASIPQLNGTYNITCFGGNDGSIALNVSGGISGYSYLWSTLAVSDSIGGLTAGTYTVTVTDQNNCTATGTYQVTEPPQLVSAAGQNNVICGINSDTLSANVPSYGTGSWSVLTGSGTFFNPFAANTVVTGLSQGVNVFQWVVTDGVCSAVSQVVITFNNQVQAIAGSNREICADSVILTATAPQFGTGYWSVYLSSGSFIDSTSAITLVTGLNPGANVFQWNVINGTCYDSSLVNIFVKDPSDCLDEVEIPTGFTPNGDGKNDFFEIRGIENYEENVLVVYNRWGNKVFEKSQYANDWEGTNNSGDPLPAGTYFYIFKVRDTGKTYTNYIDIRR